MPFTFKLSVRLALMKAWVVFSAAAVLAACELPGRHVTDPNPPNTPVVQVFTSPDTVTLDPYQERQFLAFGRTEAGDSVAVAVRWTASGGTITAGGLYRADTLYGDYQVMATATSSPVTGNSRVRNRGPLVAVIVTPPSASVGAGSTRQFAAYGRKRNGDSVAVSVVYSATGGTIVPAGLYTAGATAGAYRVIATHTGVSLADTAAVAVTSVPVASVAVSPASAGVAVGQTVQLSATPKDANGSPLTGRTVTWGTTNPAVATVNGSGLVTGTAAGTATITASSEGQSGTAAIAVTLVPVASVAVSPASASVAVGQTVQLTATLKDASGTPLSGRVVTWSSGAPAVATVSATGLVTSVAAGTATITATSEGKSGTAGITVAPTAVASVSVSPAAPSVPAGQTVQLAATPKDASGTPLTGRVVTWSSTAPAVATVNGSGLVTGLAAGSTTITASSEGKSGTATVTVTAAPPPPGPPGTVSNLTVAGVTDSSVTLSFTEVTDGTGQPADYAVRWAQGGLSWVSATDVTRGSCAVPVAGTAIGATRTCTVLGLQSGTGYQFQLVAFRGTLNVDAVFGGLSNVASGTTVPSTAPVATVTVSPASASIVAGTLQQFTAVLKDASGNILSGRAVTWSSNALTVATVNGSGLVTSLVAGTATVTAQSEGKSGSATITVTPVPSGGVVLFQEAFEDNAFAGRGWYDNTNPATTTAQHLPGSTRALEMHFLAGALTPVAGGAVRHLFQPTPTLYVSYWVKYSANWVGSGRPYHPHEFLVMSDQDGDWDGPSNGWLVNYIEHSYQNGGIPRLGMQDSKAINTSFGALPRSLIGVTENRSTAGCNGVVEPNVGTSCFNMPPWYNDKGVFAAQPAFQPTAGPGYKGNWNHVEVYLQLNSVVGGIGVADGVMQYWFNGALVIDRHDILFRTGARPTIKFHQFVIAPYIGDGSPVDQYMWIDDLTLATGRP
jgi:uncharacterized protein YjdB